MLVSCLMPTLNRRKFIPRAVMMWQNQTHIEKELIVIDDGESIQDLLPPDPRIRYYRFEGTLGAKLNFGALVARGDVLINWDDDDWQHPRRIEAQLDHMRTSGKPFVGFSSLIYYTEGEEHGWEYTGDAWYASGSTHCYMRDYALRNHRPDKTVGEDNDSVARARENRALSTMSGCHYLVASDHGENCSRKIVDPALQFLNQLQPDNYLQIPLSVFIETISL